MGASHVFPFLRVLAVEDVLAFKQVPDLDLLNQPQFFIIYVGDLATTNQTSNVPNINAVAPWYFQAHFWRPIDVWLHILVMLGVPRNSRAKVA